MVINNHHTYERINNNNNNNKATDPGTKTSTTTEIVHENNLVINYNREEGDGAPMEVITFDEDEEEDDDEEEELLFDREDGKLNTIYKISDEISPIENKKSEYNRLLFESKSNSPNNDHYFPPRISKSEGKLKLLRNIYIFIITQP